MSEDGEVSTKKFLVGLVMVIVTGAFIGVATATDIDLRIILFGWMVIILGFLLFGRWKGSGG